MFATAPILADIDGQVVFVIVALVAGFIQWLIKLAKQKEEASLSSSPTAEEAETRRRAWKEQTRPAPPPMPRTPPAVETLEDVIAEMRKVMTQPAAPKTPPPMPPPSRPLAPPALVPAESTAPSSVPVLQSIRMKREPHPLTRLLQSPGGYQQAFVMREVLGPPRSLQEYRGPED